MKENDSLRGIVEVEVAKIVLVAAEVIKDITIDQVLIQNHLHQQHHRQEEKG